MVVASKKCNQDFVVWALHRGERHPYLPQVVCKEGSSRKDIGYHFLPNLGNLWRTGVCKCKHNTYAYACIYIYIHVRVHSITIRIKCSCVYLFIFVVLDFITVPYITIDVLVIDQSICHYFHTFLWKSGKAKCPIQPSKKIAPSHLLRCLEDQNPGAFMNTKSAATNVDKWMVWFHSLSATTVSWLPLPSPTSSPERCPPTAVPSLRSSCSPHPTRLTAHQNPRWTPGDSCWLFGCVRIFQVLVGCVGTC